MSGVPCGDDVLQQLDIADRRVLRGAHQALRKMRPAAFDVLAG